MASSSDVEEVRRRHQDSLRHHREEGRHRQLGERRGLDLRQQELPLSVLLHQVTKNNFEDEVKLKELQQRLTEHNIQSSFINELVSPSNMAKICQNLTQNPSNAMYGLLANLALHLDDQTAARVARSVGPALISTLSPTGGSLRLKPISARVVAHLARNKPRASQVLVNQGCLEALADCMECNEVNELASNALYLVLIHRPQIEEPILADILDVLLGKLDEKCPIFLFWTVFVLVSHWPSLHNEIHDLNKLIVQCLDVCIYEIFKKADSRPLVKIVTPIVRILANLCAGSRALEAVMALLDMRSGCDVVAVLTALLATNYTHLCQETLWLVTNVVNNEELEVQERLIELGWTERLELHVQQAWQRTQPWNLHVQ